MTDATITPCSDTAHELGEGILWHPTAETLLWFDVLKGHLYARGAAGLRRFELGEIASAAGWIDRERVLVATESRLVMFDLTTGAVTRTLSPLAGGDPTTRCNDGRADRQGGFWISTMGKTAAKGRAAIHRWYRGELRVLFEDMTIPNAICFSGDGTRAFFTDTPTAQVMTVALDPEGWPAGQPSVWLDLAGEGLNPDGAVTDAEDNLWIAQWGAGRVACHAPSGEFLRAVAFPVPNTSCPAIGGPALDTLYCTTARQGMSREALAAHPQSGLTFAATGTGIRGRPEPRVVI